MLINLLQIHYGPDLHRIQYIVIIGHTKLPLYAIRVLLGFLLLLSRLYRFNSYPACQSGQFARTLWCERARASHNTKNYYHCIHISFLCISRIFAPPSTPPQKNGVHVSECVLNWFCFQVAKYGNIIHKSKNTRNAAIFNPFISLEFFPHSFQSHATYAIISITPLLFTFIICV